MSNPLVPAFTWDEFQKLLGADLSNQQDDPVPPYPVRNVTSIYLWYRLTEAQAAGLLPPGLTFHPSHLATIAFYEALDGWGIAPFTAFFFTLDVEGFDSPDGSAGQYMSFSTYSGKAGIFMPRHYNALAQAGEVGFTVTPTELRASGPVEGVGRITVAVQRGLDTGQSRAGAQNFLGPGPDGELILWNAAYSFNFTRGAITEFQLDLPLDHPLAVLADLTPFDCLCFTDQSHTYSVPVPASRGLTLQSLVSPFLDILSRLGRPLAIVEDTGRILFLTGEAEAVLGKATGAARRFLPAEFRTALMGPDISNTVRTGINRSARLTLPGGTQILATAFPIALRLSDAPAMMVLLNDPHQPGSANPEPLLRLMGLTPSEAALAALIGAGATPAEAAAARGITQSTARSTLKLIFSKLGLRRQADLAQIVTRLQMG